MRRVPLAVAAGVLALLGVTAGVLALAFASTAALPLVSGAIASGAIAAVAAGVLFLGRTPGRYENRYRGMVGRGQLIPTAVAGLAVVSAVCGEWALFVGPLPLLAWIMVAAGGATVVLGVVCGLVGDNTGLLILIGAAGAVLFAGAVFGIVVLFRAGQTGWAWFAIGVLLVVVLGVTWVVFEPSFPTLLGQRGPRIPATIGWVGPAVAVGTAWFVERGTGAILLLGAYVAGQLVVQKAVLGLLLPAADRDDLRRIAIESRWNAHESVESRRSEVLFRELSRLHQRLEDPEERQRIERQLYDLEDSLRARQDRYRDPIDFDDRSRTREVVQRVRSGLLVPAAARSTAVLAARTEGVVLDDLWPRLELVAPAPARRRIAWLAQGIALSRVTAASAVGAAVVLLVVGQIGAVLVPALAFAVAVAVGRQQVADAYAGRAAVSGVHRMDLVRTMGLRQPGSASELVALGAVVSGGRLDPWQDPIAMADGSGPRSAEADGRVGDRLQEAIAAELRSGIDLMLQRQQTVLDRLTRLNLAPGDVDQIATKVADRTAAPLTSRVTEALTIGLTTGFTELQDQLSASVVQVVQTAMTGPELLNFSGYLVVELATDRDDVAVSRVEPGTIAAPAGATVALLLSLVSDPRAGESVPDRRSLSDGPFVALETVHIEGGRTDSVVPFDALVDSSTMTPTPHRVTMRVARPHGEQQATLALDVPDRPGVHEAWLQLFQAGRLVQAVVLTVDTRG